MDCTVHGVTGLEVDVHHFPKDKETAGFFRVRISVFSQGTTPAEDITLFINDRDPLEEVLAAFRGVHIND